MAAFIRVSVVGNIDQIDGIESCYLDNDGDGFGVAVITSSPTVSCLLPGFSDVTSGAMTPTQCNIL